MYGNELNCAAAEKAAPRNPEVNAWLESLGYAVDRLGTMAAALDVQLQPVLGPCEPSSDGGASASAHCGIARTIQSRTLQLNDIEAALQSILRRLEV